MATPLKSGLDAESQFVIGESREEFAELQTDHYDHYQPGSPEERFQVDTLIRTEWFLRRFFRVEAQLWEYHALQADRSSGVQLGEAFSKASPIFMRLQRRVTAAEKSHKEAKAELDRLKQARQPEQSTAQTQQLASFRKPAPAEEPLVLDQEFLEMANARRQRFGMEPLPYRSATDLCASSPNRGRE